MISSIKNINIAHIVLSMEIGGLERLVEQIFKQSVSDGSNSHLLCLDRLGVIGEQLKLDKYSIQSLDRKPGFIDFKLLKKLSNILNKNDISIIHCHNQEALFYSVLLKIYNPGLKIIHSQHGVEPPINIKKIIKQYFLCKFVNQYVGVSDDVCNIAEQKYKISENKTSVILNGVNTEVFNKDNHSTFSDLGQQYGIKPDDVVIICVARLAAIKNHGLLIEVIAKLNESIDNYKMLIVGDGPEREAIEAQVAEYNLTDSIVMLGEQNKVVDFLSISDIFLLTSFSEGINVSLLEAMSMKVAPVVTNVGGNKEVISSDMDGVLIDGFDASNISAKLIELIENKEYLNNLKEKSRIKVINQFSFQSMLNQYYTLYTG